MRLSLYFLSAFALKFTEAFAIRMICCDTYEQVYGSEF